MSFKGKVKALLEEKSKPSPEERGKAVGIKHKALVAKVLGSKKSQTEVPQELGNLPGFAKVVFHHKAHRSKEAPKEGLGPPPIKFSKKSQTENSNHPFYQKVKALSRGKKNNSLLERKSLKLLSFILASLKPCEKKSKMDGEKKKSKKDEEEEKSKMDEAKKKVRDHDKQAFFNWDDPVEAAKQKALAAIDAAEEKMKADEFKQSRTRELLKVYKHPESGEDVERESKAPRHEQKPRFTGNWFQRRRKRRAAARRPGS